MISSRHCLRKVFAEQTGYSSFGRGGRQMKRALAISIDRNTLIVAAIAVYPVCHLWIAVMANRYQIFLVSTLALKPILLDDPPTAISTTPYCAARCNEVLLLSA